MIDVSFKSSFGTYERGITQVVVNHSLYQEKPLIEEERSSLDYSIPGNRLIQHTDGTLELIPHHPAYIFGEKVVRPVLDLSIQVKDHVYSLLQKGLVSLDGAVSCIFSFIPKTNAAVIADSIQTKYCHLSRERAVIPTSLKEAFVDDDQFIHELALQQKEKLLQNDSGQKNFLEIRKIIKEFSLFIESKINNHEIFKRDIRDACLSMKLLKRAVNSILMDLQSKGERSTYSPIICKKLVLILPQYSNGYDKTIREGRCLRNGCPVSPNLTGIEYQKLQKTCSENLLEETLIEYLITREELFGLDQPIPLSDPFQQLFNTEMVSNLKAHIEGLKKDIDLGFSDVKDLVSLMMRDLQSEIQNQIFNDIYLIFQEHTKIMKLQNSHFRIGDTIFDEVGRPIAWEVIDPSRITKYWDELVFKFYMEDATKPPICRKLNNWS